MLTSALNRQNKSASLPISILLPGPPSGADKFIDHPSLPNKFVDARTSRAASPSANSKNVPRIDNILVPIQFDTENTYNNAKSLFYLKCTMALYDLVSDE